VAPAAGAAPPAGVEALGAAPAGGPRRLVYLSCGYAALERDAAALVAGGWRVASAVAFVFFPGTDALETLAVFDRD
jgi:23S rRNA (uracil1939-C5)-methyltransferase